MQSTVIDSMVSYLVAPRLFNGLASGYLSERFRFGEFTKHIRPTLANAKDRYDQRHGGPFDRGSADSWYNRGVDPHYFTGDTHQSERIGVDQMTAEEIDAYVTGYRWNEEFGGKKDYS